MTAMYSLAKRDGSGSRARGSPLCVLTIAGSDSGAGAGIQADGRAIRALGGFALTAITAITAQNTRGVSAWQAVPARLIAQQIAAVLADFPVGAVKTGLLPGAAAVRAVAAALPEGLPLVVDPVLGSTSGTRFLGQAGVRALRRHLLPKAALVTPNWPEAALLSGRPVATFAEAEAAARALCDVGCRAVLVKGGHSDGPVCRDCLVTADGSVRWFRHPRRATRNTHGTGCVLSAAIATGLARGLGLAAAVRTAVRLLQKGLREGQALRWGAGAGPAYPGLQPLRAGR